MRRQRAGIQEDGEEAEEASRGRRQRVQKSAFPAHERVSPCPPTTIAPARTGGCCYTRGSEPGVPVQALAYWKAVTTDKAGFLDRVVALLRESGVRYCVIGGQGVNAYAEPLVSLYLDLVIAARDLERLRLVMTARFVVEEFPHSINISSPDSQLRVQIQTDPRYMDFPDRAERREVLGLELPVASLSDLLQGKIWAASDPARRATKRQKDILDIARLIERYPHLRPRVPADLLKQIAS